MAVDKHSVSVGGYYFQAKQVKIGWESLATEDSGRTLDGVMHINWVFRKIRKIEIVLPPCTEEQIMRIIEKVQGKEYYINYYDPSLQARNNIYVYTSNASTNQYSGVVHNGLWRDFEFHAIEIAGE